MQAGWTNIEYYGSSLVETLDLTGYGSAGQTVKIYSGGGNDDVTGGTYAEMIDGQDGNDVLSGGGGNDTVIGGAGADFMTGGSGSDTFVFAAGDSGVISSEMFDTIDDYAVGAGGDKLDLVGVGLVRADVASPDAINVALGGNVGRNITATVSNGVITLHGDDLAEVDTLGEWIAVARAVVTSDMNGQVVAFEFVEEGDTYVFQENGDGDLLIQLMGVTDITSVGTGADGADGRIWIE